MNQLRVFAPSKRYFINEVADLPAPIIRTFCIFLIYFTKANITPKLDFLTLILRFYLVLSIISSFLSVWLIILAFLRFFSSYNLVAQTYYSISVILGKVLGPSLMLR